MLWWETSRKKRKIWEVYRLQQLSKVSVHRETAVTYIHRSKQNNTLRRIVKVKSKSQTIYRSDQASGKVYILNVVYSKHDRFRA